jgi:hypothetical protein
MRRLNAEATAQALGAGLPSLESMLPKLRHEMDGMPNGDETAPMEEVSA